MVAMISESVRAKRVIAPSWIGVRSAGDSNDPRDQRRDAVRIGP